jgi:DNA-binding transcriptional regulator GbsR (MarR family)
MKPTTTFALLMSYTNEKNMALSDKQKSVVEQIGINYEKFGMQPAAARVMGLLYVADKPELTFDEITDCLQISKSATSNAINLLLQTEQIEYTTFSGDRKRYFRLKISNWREGFAKKIESMTSFASLLRQVLEVRTKETADFNASLDELINFMDYIHLQLPKLLQDWENTKK